MSIVHTFCIMPYVIFVLSVRHFLYLINDFYWYVVSTGDGNEDVIKEKWLSLLNHVHNVHRRHGKIYKRCNHGRLRRKWFKYSK